MPNDAAAWKQKVTAALNTMLDAAPDARKKEGASRIGADAVTASVPPDSSMGDISFALFSFAKVLRKAPERIALDAERLLNDRRAKAFGAYLNIRLDRPAAARSILASVFDAGSDFWNINIFNGKKIVVEFSSPNTNKPLHLGHLRNNALGESISRILAACGAKVEKVCIINNRGIHICKSMLAYMDEGMGATPEDVHKKSDHFVGDWYVRFSARLKSETETIMKEKNIPAEEAEAQSALLSRARALLVQWERGDAETAALWEKMNGWAVDGMKRTYERTGVSFDKYYYESETYLLGREEVLKGLEKGVFYREADGSIWADLTAEKLDKKVLLRGDGTSLYITQDFGTAIERHKDFSFDTMIYVVGNEQRYHFQVLFTLLSKLNFEWAKNLYHLSYGMVNLPEGRMKTREGTVVDADTLLDSLAEMAKEEIREKEREEIIGDINEVSEKIALGAMHYYLLQVSPEHEMLFNPKESLSFNGNTGPYLQYMGARISSLIKKAEREGYAESLLDISKSDISNFDMSDFEINDYEWELLKTIARWPDALTLAAQKYNPSAVAFWVRDLSKNFSRFYHECPILARREGAKAENRALARFRLILCKAVLEALRRALELIGVPFLAAM